MHIDVWSDFACPWCALGLYRLDAALAQFDHGAHVTVRHRAFELDPFAPKLRKESLEAVLAARYAMSSERIKAGHDALCEMGAHVGMEFHFDRVTLANTFDAHRVAEAARGTEAEDRVQKALFGAYFTEGAPLSDPEVLVRTASGAGLDAALAREVVEGDAFSDEVRADEQAARELGISGVPHFVINGAWAVPGAQDVDTLVTLLRRAWDRSGA